MRQITEWIEDGHCALRAFVGTDPSKIENRVAFIEKTPRVRIRPHYMGDNGHGQRQWEDFLNWAQGPKGAGGGDPKKDGTYGFDVESRAWCDRMLVALGYELPSSLAQ